MSLAYEGRVVATNSPQVTITQEAYDKLSDAQKNDPNINYFILDAVDNDYAKLVKLLTTVGDEQALAELPGGGTIIGAIVELNRRLGGISFSLDPEFKNVIATKTDENPNNEIQQLADDATDSQKITYLQTLLGSVSNLSELGYDTVVGALKDLFEKLDGLSFEYKTKEETELNSDTVQVTDET